MDLQCPACDAPLDEAGRTYRCRLCEGAWVTEEALIPILEQRASTLVDLPWKPREDEKPRPCAECQAAMQTVDLGKVQLDRCPSHGVWFDADELAALLREAKHFTTKEMPAVSEPKHGLLGKLAKLFGG
jgi:Zn-finger nucleic acid-binding protein